MPAGRFLPSTQLEHNKDLFGNVLFTVGFLIIFAFVRLRGKDLFYNLLNTLLKRKKAEIILNEGISSNLICYILSLCLSFSIISIGIVYIIEGNFINLFTLYLFIGLFLYHFLLLLIVRLFGWTFKDLQYFVRTFDFTFCNCNLFREIFCCYSSIKDSYIRCNFTYDC